MRLNKKNTSQYLQRKFVELLIFDIMVTEIYNRLNTVELTEGLKQREEVMKLIEQVIKKIQKK